MPNLHPTPSPDKNQEYDDKPVLPPGCRLEPSSRGTFVMDARGRVLTEGPTPERAAADAWYQLGAFISREDYEAGENRITELTLELKHARMSDAMHRGWWESACRERNEHHDALASQRGQVAVALAEIDKLNAHLAESETLRMVAEAETQRSYDKVNQVLTDAANERERLLAATKSAEDRAHKAETLVQKLGEARDWEENARFLMKVERDELRGKVVAWEVTLEREGLATPAQREAAQAALSEVSRLRTRLDAQVKFTREAEAERDQAVAIQDRLREEMMGHPWVDLDTMRRRIKDMEVELCAAKLLDQTATNEIHELRADVKRLRERLDDIRCLTV